ncbi:MAG: hypothetical protein ACR2QW_20380 [bacterium]
MGTPVESITDNEIAEVIDLIDQLKGEGTTQSQALGLCRSVADLVNIPKLALHGIFTLIELGKTSDKQRAADALDRIAWRYPKVRWIQFRCGHHYGELVLYQKGVECYLRAISIKPTVKSHHNIALLYRKLMQFESCIEHLEKALVLNPDSYAIGAELLFLMAMKGDLRRFAELEKSDRMSGRHLANCYNRLGQTLVYQGERQQAMDWFDKAVKLRPESFIFQWSKHLTVPTIYRSEKDVKASRKKYLSGLTKITDLYQTLPDEEKSKAHQCTQLLTNFEIHYQSEQDLEVQRPYGALYHNIMLHCYPQFMRSLPRRHPGNARRVRVGFASYGCFFAHSNYKTHGAWITELNSDRFEVFAYALSTQHDQSTARIKDSVEHFIPFGGNVQRLRQRILSDDLDILVYPGIGMEPVVHRLAPLRLAPVQCTSWGHPVTTGLPNIDYFLSSDLMEPENAQEHYTETLVRLPNLGISQNAPGLPKKFRAPEALEDRARPSTVYLCSQNILKMLPDQDYLFARILQTVSDSEIWFICSKRKDINDTFIARMEKTCQSYGVDFKTRCLMLPRLGKAEFCYVNQHADVMLDTSFWSGCNTTFETLMHGTPVITLPGNTMRGRHTAAILRLHGLDELICESEQEFISLAARLAQDEEYCGQIKSKIESIQPNLFGDAEVITALENFFERSLTGDV